LDRARLKAYQRILPLLCLCYVIAYVDRTNVAIAKLTMVNDLPAFDNAVIAFGGGLFFWGYVLLEIPGSLLVEKWSARRLLCRIMVTWGIIAMLTSLVRTPGQFYGVRFALGLAEAGFFPGVIVFLTHWFTARDRARALAYFLIATPVAQIVSPKISNALLKIGSTEVANGVTIHHAAWFGFQGWQWLYLFWGFPAVVLGFIVLFWLPDRPRNARWLTSEERDALETELASEKALAVTRKRMTVLAAFQHPKVLLLTAAYFCSTTATYGIEFFLPSILQKWYALKLDAITWLVILPPALALFGQWFNGWHSDRKKERYLHAVAPITLGMLVLALTPTTRGHLALTITCFMVAFTGLKSYQPAFWSLPSLFLSETAAAASIGLINSLGNLGGSAGPMIMGNAEKLTGSFSGGIYAVCGSMTLCAAIILSLRRWGCRDH